MTRICAWCKTVMGEFDPIADKRETHGICEPCEKIFNDEAGAKVEASTKPGNYEVVT